MDEQRADVQAIDVVEIFPTGRSASSSCSNRRRSDASASPTRARRERSLRCNLPSRNAGSRTLASSLARIVLRHPAPNARSTTPVQEIDQCTQFALVGRRRCVEILARSENAADQQRRVDHRQARLPNARAGFDVEKVIVEALVSSCRRAATLVAVAKQAQRRKAVLDRGIARCIQPRSTAIG